MSALKMGTRIALARPLGLRPPGSRGNVVRLYRKGSEFAARVRFEDGGQIDLYRDEFDVAAPVGGA